MCCERGFFSLSYISFGFLVTKKKHHSLKSANFVEIKQEYTIEKDNYSQKYAKICISRSFIKLLVQHSITHFFYMCIRTDTQILVLLKHNQFGTPKSFNLLDHPSIRLWINKQTAWSIIHVEIT